jgi:hypothetical protein
MALPFTHGAAKVPVMILRALLILSLLASCGRPLTETETAFAKAMHGNQINTKKVRLVNGAPTASVTFRRQKRPRITCRERIFPEPTEQIVTTSPAAVAIFNRVYFDKDWYIENYMREYPGRVNLVAAMLFAHEMTHIWQWQNRSETGYHPLKAASEHGGGADPYLFEIRPDARLSDYGFEQQGGIVEEFVCCAALAPEAPRTARLHALLKQSFPISDVSKILPNTEIIKPWDGAEIDGICS